MIIATPRKAKTPDQDRGHRRLPLAERYKTAASRGGAFIKTTDEVSVLVCAEEKASRRTLNATIIVSS